MLTKAQWDGMTAQAQWDFVQSLMADVEAVEAAAYDPPAVIDDDEDMTY